MQEAAKLIDSYSDIIDVIRKSPNENQKIVCNKMGAKYTRIWTMKVIKQLRNVGLVNELKTQKKVELTYEVNDDLIRLVEQFARQYSEQIQR